jgi:hypothetical protein
MGCEASSQQQQIIHPKETQPLDTINAKQIAK